ncbi:MAG: VWA domain-containing protein [Deltaproteobacteria bacterium]|nr:VWA domain-containing protein [Deltaproteobacteria bacterium]
MPVVEIGFTTDRTGSTAAFSAGVKKSLPLILDPIKDKARGVTVWLQTHGDRDTGQDEVLLTDGGTPDQAIADAGSIVYEGGGDPPEHHLDAVETLHARIPWNPNPAEARGALIAITTDESKPAQSGRSAEEIGRAIKESGVTLYVIGQPTAVMLELVEAAGGFFFEISNDPQVTELRRVADMVAASITASFSRATATRPAPAPTA